MNLKILNINKGLHTALLITVFLQPSVELLKKQDNRFWAVLLRYMVVGKPCRDSTAALVGDLGFIKFS